MTKVYKVVYHHVTGNQSVVETVVSPFGDWVSVDGKRFDARPAKGVPGVIVHIA